MHINGSIETTLAALADLPAPLYATDPDGRILLWNRAMTTLTGIAEERGRFPGPLLAVAENLVPLEGDNPLLDVVLESKARLVRQGSLLSINGPHGERAVDFTGEPLLDGGGTLVGALAVLNERTPERTMEKTLDGIERTAGHDLRNAVGVLEGYLPLLLNGEASRMEDGGHAIFQTLQRTSHLLNSIVNLMLLNARCCRSLEVKEARPVLLQEILTASRRAIEPMAANKDIVLAASVDDQLLVRVQEELLYAALVNLYFSASKLARNRSVVQVTAQKQDSEGADVRMSFAARAVEPLDQRRMFSALGAVQDPRLSVGVSVHLASSILRLHGATLRLVEPEVGTNEFAFVLPDRQA